MSGEPFKATVQKGNRIQIPDFERDEYDIKPGDLLRVRIVKVKKKEET